MAQEKKAKTLTIMTLNKAKSIGFSTETLESKVTTLQNTVYTLIEDVSYLQNQLAGLTNMFNITYDAYGNVVGNTYTSHTHSYVDTDTPDTVDGSGTTVETNKTTGGVNT